MVLDANPLDGQVALVTGASSGIGEATAKALADAGASVGLAARRESELQAVADDIESAGGEALVVPTDVTEESQVESMIDTTASELGGLDILVNNAGVMLLEAVADADTDNWRQMVEVNLLGLMSATKTALPVMKENGGGHVVNVSSIAGRMSMATGSGYNATKFGVNGFTEAFRKEVTDDGIRTTIIEPGLVDTELADHIPDEDIQAETEEWVDSIEPLTGEDIARSIRFAVSQPQHVSINEMLIRPTQQEM
ncbi:hypothetical protein SAMN04488065_1945 [Haloplanus vescus]|uniref:NADP-dependent 3-hydroxy acid dehydrogenase YdfG n=1 Tax=Haloplanus vescus TaxID=555874 RepID=A0A1H3YM26_9EURY|nr:SDR family NAD(P)-dependent oxidoreductase [Haloplanus vescus]SEA12068.1 hypothetical protein SAMN04488065_1945 [Haloplanus vescus]